MITLPTVQALPPIDGEFFDFYRCGGCGRIITRLQEALAMRTGRICKCNRRSYSPDDPKWWEFALPRVILFTLYRVFKRL
jgi:hypothetical protein